jgi:hypothetical protein
VASQGELVGGEDKIDPIRERYHGDQFIINFGSEHWKTVSEVGSVWADIGFVVGLEGTCVWMKVARGQWEVVLGGTVMLSKTTAVTCGWLNASRP